MILFFLPSQIRSKVKRHPPVAWFLDVSLFILLLSVIHMFLFRYIEQSTWNEALWQTWQTFTTVGYGNAPAETLLGRLVSIILATAGIAMVGVLFAAALDIHLYRTERRRKGMVNNPIKNGYVIFNFPGTSVLQHLIDETRYTEPDAGFCIIDGRIGELPSSFQIQPHIHFIHGSVLEKDTYKRAKLDKNKVVIVFPVEKGKDDSDGVTKTIVDILPKFIGDETRIIHILVDPDNNWMFEGLPSTPIMESLEILAVAQECQDPHSAHALQNLLLNTEGANPNAYKVKNLVGMTWQEIQEKAPIAARKIDMPVIPFALVHDNTTYTCPDFETKIHENDSLLVFTVNELKWDEFEAEVRRL
ncbi:potassium channel family protein [bacterium]|nr:potassium channel family protein [bacterium]